MATGRIDVSKNCQCILKPLCECGEGIPDPHTALKQHLLDQYVKGRRRYLSSGGIWQITP